MNEGPLFEEIPQAIYDGILEQLGSFSVGFVRRAPKDRDTRVELLGSGTLVKAGDRHAVLTASHVLDALPRDARLGIVLDSANHMLSLNGSAIQFMKIARGTEDSIGPDLGYVLLASPVAASIAAQKRFFSLDLHRDKVLQHAPPIEHGLWVAAGFPDELTRRDATGATFQVAFCNQALMGVVERCPDVGEFDFFDFPIEPEHQPKVPRHFGGMSGGGLWQIQFSQDKNRVLTASPATLSGVIFYQLPTTDAECGLRCHGRRSVYEIAYSKIVGAR